MADSGRENIFGEKSDLSDADLFLIGLYIQTGVALDSLAYTPEFETLYERFVSRYPASAQVDVFRRLISLRKRGQLPRLSRIGDDD
jgi:hypothetical protein